MSPGARSDGARRALRRVACLCGLALSILACATQPSMQLPPLETWGDPRSPYGDSLEAAAFEALESPPAGSGRRRGFAPVRLGEFAYLDGVERSMRQSAAAGLVARAGEIREQTGIDSLPFYLEALRTDPACVPAFENAVRVLVGRHADARAHALAVQGLRLEPRSARLWALLAETYMRAGKDGAARQALERALSLDKSRMTNACSVLAVLYVECGQVARADSLLQVCRSTVAPWLGPFIAAKRARQSGDLEAARREYEAAALDPDVPVAVLVDLGVLEYELGHLDAAERAFGRALRLSPGEAAALGGIGVVQRLRGDLDAAITSFACLVAAEPSDSLAQFNLAGASLDAAQRAGSGGRADSLYAVSEQAFSACIAAGFRVAEARERRAHLRLRRGDAAGATADARALLELPDHAAAGRLLLARAAMAGNRPQEVVAVLSPDFERDALGADALHILGKAYLQLDRPSEAALVLRRAHERQPQDWRTAMNFAVSLSRSGGLVEAESILRALAVGRPRDADVLQNLAAVLQRRGRRAEADRLLRQAQALRAP